MPDPLANTQNRLDDLESFHRSAEPRLRKMEDEQLTNGKFSLGELLKTASLSAAIGLPILSIIAGLGSFFVNSKLNLTTKEVDGLRKDLVTLQVEIASRGDWMRERDADVAALRSETTSLASDVLANRATLESAALDRWKGSDHDRYASFIDQRLQRLESGVFSSKFQPHAAESE
ncbi:hypothetical protein AAFN60_01965 [Roseibacillus persicicus]|uniref:hypothetical protein n=1 Tax=Roseibacillus persicicus TaxID=454148 RepID=UPI00398BA055